MKNKKLLYILAISIGFSSNNALSMGSWFSEKLSGFTTAATNYLSPALNRMSEWSIKQKFAVATAALITLAAAIGHKRLYQWFNGIMGKIENVKLFEDLEELKQAGYPKKGIAWLREKYKTPSEVEVIDKALINRYENKIVDVIRMIEDNTTREAWIKEAKDLVTASDIPVKREGGEFGIEGTKYKALLNVEKRMSNITSTYSGGEIPTIPFPEQVLRLEK